jgi:hypothetical protein
MNEAVSSLQRFSMGFTRQEGNKAREAEALSLHSAVSCYDLQITPGFLVKFFQSEHMSSME